MLDEYGDPLVDMQVTAMRAMWTRGERRLAIVTTAGFGPRMTDDSGASSWMLQDGRWPAAL